MQNNRQRHQARPRNARRANRSEQRGQDDGGILFDVQFDAIDLRDKQGADAMVERRAVKIDIRAERQHETRNIARHAEMFFRAVHRNRQRGGTAGRRKRDGHCLKYAFEKTAQAEMPPNVQ